MYRRPANPIQRRPILFEVLGDEGNRQTTSHPYSALATKTNYGKAAQGETQR